jgi:hypothetical protein
MSNSGRGGRPSYASLDKHMKAYDALPKSVRQALAEGYENWATYKMHRRWEAGRYRSARELIAKIRGWNREQAAEDRRALLGALNGTKPHKGRRRA